LNSTPRARWRGTARPVGKERRVTRVRGKGERGALGEGGFIGGGEGKKKIVEKLW